jgi:hypothetical protein
MLTQSEVEALNNCRGELPPTGPEHVLNGVQRAAYHPGAHLDETPPAHGLHHVRIEQLRERPPARRRSWPGGRTPRRVAPVSALGQQRCQGVLIPIGHKQRWTVRRQQLGALLHDPLRPGPGPRPHLDGQQPLALGLSRRPHPVGCTLKGFDGLCLADHAGFHVTQEGRQRIHVQLMHVDITQESTCKDSEVLRGFPQPVPPGVGGDFDAPSGAADTQPLGYACQPVDNALDRSPFAMKDRPMMLWNGAVAGRTVQLSPRTTPGMAIGPQVV